MKFTTTFYLLGAVIEAATFADVFGPAPKVSVLKSWEERKQALRRTFRMSTAPIIKDDEYYLVRDPSNCRFPLEVVIVQDTTSSTFDNFINMRDTQLDLMIEALNQDHPNSQYGVTSFRDKPIWTLGSPDADYCWVIESELSHDSSRLHSVYENIIPIGGGDVAENQMGALLATAQSEFVGWSSSIASRLMVLVTDAQPHFEGDGFQKPEYNMTPFSGTFDEMDMDVQCLAEYYPHPDQVVQSILDRETYVAFIVYDGEYQGGLPTEAWTWFNSYLGQTAGFVGDLGAGSTSFWASLSQVIREIEQVECGEETTEEPTELESSVEENSTQPAVETSTLASTGEVEESTEPAAEPSTLASTSEVEESTEPAAETSTVASTSEVEESTEPAAESSTLASTSEVEESTEPATETSILTSTGEVEESTEPAVEPSTLTSTAEVEESTEPAAEPSTLASTSEVEESTEPATETSILTSTAEVEESTEPAADPSTLASTSEVEESTEPAAESSTLASTSEVEESTEPAAEPSTLASTSEVEESTEPAAETSTVASTSEVEESTEPAAESSTLASTSEVEESTEPAAETTTLASTSEVTESTEPAAETATLTSTGEVEESTAETTTLASTSTEVATTEETTEESTLLSSTVQKTTEATSPPP